MSGMLQCYTKNLWRSVNRTDHKHDSRTQSHNYGLLESTRQCPLFCLASFSKNRGNILQKYTKGAKIIWPYSNTVYKSHYPRESKYYWPTVKCTPDFTRPILKFSQVRSVTQYLKVYQQYHLRFWESTLETNLHMIMLNFQEPCYGKKKNQKKKAKLSNTLVRLFPISSYFCVGFLVNFI